MQSVKAFISWEDNPPIEAFLKMDPRSGTLQLPAMVFSCCGARKKVFSLAPSTAEAREIHRRVEGKHWVPAFVPPTVRLNRVPSNDSLVASRSFHRNPS